MPNQTPQESEWEKLTWGQKIETGAWWASFPALTLMVFVRWDLGYRTVRPVALIGIAVFMMLIAGISNPTHRPDDLLIFAIVVLTLGFFQRYNRWLELRQGMKSHTHYIGTSIFEGLHWPEWFLRDRRIGRKIDPFVCAVAGLLILQCSPVLGLWIIFASFCLIGFEEVVFRKQFHRDLDTLDGMVNSEIQGDTVEHFSPTAEKQADDSETIPTGLAADIKERIKRRKP